MTSANGPAGPARRLVRADVRRVVGYVPGEQPRDRRYVKLNTNENPYPPSPLVLDAIRSALGDDLRLYPDPRASDLRLRAGARYGFPPEWILAGNGSDELLGIVVRACVGPGDRVAYATPTYSLYETLVALQGATGATVPYPDGFVLPVQDLAANEGAVTVVCNPNAPSGTLTPLPLLASLAEGVRGLLVVDEAYVDFADDAAGATALPLVHRFPNVLVLRTFSKSFSLCGMRVGLAFGHPELIAELEKVKDSYNVGRLGLVAAAAALDDVAWMETNAARVREARALLAEGLRALGLSVLPSQTNFVLARRPGEDLAPLQRALRDEGVLVRHFPVPGLRDALRVTVGTEGDIRALLAAFPRAAGGSVRGP